MAMNNIPIRARNATASLKLKLRPANQIEGKTVVFIITHTHLFV
jgi:hypothetical protein